MSLKVVVSSDRPSRAHLAALRAAAPGAHIVVVDSRAEAAEAIRDADAFLGNRFFLQSLPHARRLRWMQSNSVGVDQILVVRERLDGVTVTCARGVYDDELIEHGLALVLALARGLPQARDDQRAQRWQRRPLPSLRGRHALVLAWGSVGRGIGEHLAALGMRVRGVRRTVCEQTEAVAAVRIVGPGRWRQMLPDTHVIVMALPLTSETCSMVGAAEIAALPRGALLVNIGRGGVLDEAALAEALRCGHLGAAALDTFQTEPLPPGDPLWCVPNLLVTPHVGRSPDRAPFRWEPLFAENLHRFARGLPLLNVVDKEAGY